MAILWRDEFSYVNCATLIIDFCIRAGMRTIHLSLAISTPVNGISPPILIVLSAEFQAPLSPVEEPCPSWLPTNGVLLNKTAS